MKRNRLTAVAVALTAVGVGTYFIPKGTPTGCGEGLCCWRELDAGVEQCLRKNPHTGLAEDIGAETTMPASHAVGPGCVPTPCSRMAR